MRSKILVFILAVLFPFSCLAANATDQLAQLLTNLQRMKANFVQTVYDGNGRVIQQTKGNLALQRPGKFRWQVSAPSQQLLIADGSRTWFYDKSLQQVTVQKQKGVTQGSPAMLLSGSTENLLNDFIVSQMPSNNGAQVFNLIPQQKNNMFKAVVLSFTQQKLTTMKLIDNFGQQTIINFSQVQVNPVLSATMFRFTTPRGVDVVSE